MAYPHYAAVRLSLCIQYHSKNIFIMSIIFRIFAAENKARKWRTYSK